MLGTVVTLSL